MYIPLETYPEFASVTISFAWNILSPKVFCDTENASNSLRPGLRQQPRWGNLQRSPRLPCWRGSSRCPSSRTPPTLSASSCGPSGFASPQVFIPQMLRDWIKHWGERRGLGDRIHYPHPPSRNPLSATAIFVRSIFTIQVSITPPCQ